MTAAPEIKSTRQVRRKTSAPHRLPEWMQVGIVALLLAQGVQTALHFSSSRVAQTAPASSPQNLSGFEYVYQPDRLSSAAPQARNAYDPYGAVRAMNSGSQLATYQYSATYAHAPSAMSATPMRAYDMSAGRWTERDPFPAQ